MEAFLIIALIAMVALAWSIIFVRRAVRGKKVDPEAIKRTSLSSDSGGSPGGSFGGGDGGGSGGD